MMDKRMLCLIVAFLYLSIFSQAINAVQPEGKGKTTNAVTQDPDYVVLDPLPGTGQERAFCTVPDVCYYRTLTCPTECPQRKPRQNKKQKGCYIDCSNKCEATCKCNHYAHSLFVSICLPCFPFSSVSKKSASFLF